MWLTTSALEGMIDSGPAEAALTVITTDVTHEAPFGPHAFTCKVCVPVDDEMALSIDWPLKTVVLELLSNEYPMVTTL